MTSTQLSSSTEPGAAIHPATRIGSVALIVSDLNRSLDFYDRMLGFRRLSETDGMVVLGTADQPLLSLIEKPGARRQPPFSTGLYHVAILLPSRADLARTIQRLAYTHYPLGGAGDHLVSEAFYLDDPDGNGLEIYRDRPRSEWQWVGNRVQMATDPVDINSLFAEIEGDQRPWQGLPPQTQIGHIHLRVGNIQRAVDFYHGVMGFDITAQLPGAAFFSAGGYHHHIGVNTWQSQNAPLPPADSVGLRDFSVALPNQAEQDRLVARLHAAGIDLKQQDAGIVVPDPWHNTLLLTTGTLLNAQHGNA